MCKKCVICEPDKCNDDDNEHLCSECSDGLSDHSVGRSMAIAIIVIVGIVLLLIF